MNKALPWNVNGVGFDARDAAREAAHRQGKSLGEWLHGVIADHAADIGVDADEMGGQQRLNAVTSKLERLSARGAAEHDRRSRNGRTSEGARRRASWSDRDAAEPQDESARESRDAQLRRRREKPPTDTTELLLEEAIEAMERRAVRAEQRTDNALQSFTRMLERTEAERDRERDSVAVLAKKLTDIEARLTDKLAQDGQEGHDPISNALSRLESRLETIGQRPDATPNPAVAAEHAALDTPRVESEVPAATAFPTRPVVAASTQVAASTVARAHQAKAPVTPGVEAGTKERAPLTRLEAKLNSILGAPSQAPAAAPAHAFSSRTAPAPWMVERFDDSLPAARSASTWKTEVQTQRGAAESDAASHSVIQRPIDRTQAEPTPIDRDAADWMNAGRPRIVKAPASFDLPPLPAAPRLQTSLTSRLTPPQASVPVVSSDVGPDVGPDVGTAQPAPQVVAETESSLRRDMSMADGSAALAAILSGNRRLGPAIAEISRRQRILDAQVPSNTAARHHALSAPTAEQVRNESAQFAGMQSEIASLTGSIENLRLEVVGQRKNRSQHASKIDGLQADLALMADMLRDLDARNALVGLEASIQALVDSVALSRAKSPQSKTLTPVEAIVPDLRKAAQKLDASNILSELERRLRGLGKTLGGLSPKGLDSTAATLPAQVGELRTTIGLIGARPLMSEQIQTRVGALIARLERLRRHPNSKQDIRGDVDALRQLIGGLRDPSKAKAKTQIDKIEQLLTEAPQQSAEDVAGAATAEHGEFRTLERVVKELSSKLDAVQMPGAGAEAFDALQKQIATMSERFERSQDDLSKLSSLEEAMRQLFSHLEATRSSVEEAAALAAREVLRIAAQGGTKPDEAAKTSFDAFDALQDDATARTTSTLSAVQGSLDDIVSRLSSMEDEIAVVRSRRQDADASLDSGPKQDQGDAHRRIQAQAQKRIQDRIQDRIQNRIQGRLLETPPETIQALPPKQLSVALAAPAGPASSLVEETDTTPASSPSVLDKILGHRPGDETSKVATKTPSALKGTPAPAEAEENSRADFIAAARRAAKVAQADLADLKRPSSGKSTKAMRAGLLEQSRDYVTRHKRPVLLSLAALFVIAGALTVIKLGATDEGESRVADVGSAMKTARLDAPAQPVADATSETAIRSSADRAAANDAAAGKEPVKKSDTTGNGLAANMPPVAGVDTTPTGSATPLPSFAAASVPRSTQAQIPSVIPAALQSKAAAGDSAAEYALGLYYADGNGVLRDFAQAAQWYQKAADHNLAPAQYRLASLYEKGLGVPQDKGKARALYLKAAEAGNPRAMHNLAVLLADGDGKPDYDGAATWFRKAAQYGIHDSQYNLAILLARGIGVRQSLIQSYQWFAIAAAQGDADAAKKRDEVGSKLRANDIAVASALASAFHPRTAEAAAVEVQMPVGGWDSVRPASPLNSPRPKISAL